MTTMTLPSVRGLVKTSAARAVSWSRADRLIGAVTGLRHRPLVLGYHRVVEDFATSVESSIPANLTSIRMLEQQLDWVGRRFRFVTLDELGERVERGDAEPVAAVTFDDGYRDVYEVAFPVLIVAVVDPPERVAVSQFWLRQLEVLVEMEMETKLKLEVEMVELS